MVIFCNIISFVSCVRNFVFVNLIFEIGNVRRIRLFFMFLR